MTIKLLDLSHVPTEEVKTLISNPELLTGEQMAGRIIDLLKSSSDLDVICRLYSEAFNRGGALVSKPDCINSSWDKCVITTKRNENMR